MNRYSLALVNPQRTESRVRVAQFPRTEHAIQAAELMAGELGLEQGVGWQGWTVEVRGPRGTKLLSIPVSQGALLAAE